MKTPAKTPTVVCNASPGPSRLLIVLTIPRISVVDDLVLHSFDVGDLNVSGMSEQGIEQSLMHARTMFESLTASIIVMLKVNEVYRLDLAPWGAAWKD